MCVHEHSIMTIQAQPAFRCRVGESFPDFECHTTTGDFSFHQYLKSGQPYTILFSHPADFTPVCTTEIAQSERQIDRFTNLGVKLIGISCDSVEDHLAWSRDIVAYGKLPKDELSFPIIADPDRKIATLLGMLDASALGQAMPLPVRSLFLIDSDARMRIAWVYPSMVGRSYEEILRATEALIFSDKTGLATPVEWHQGDKFLVPPSLTVDQKSKLSNISVEQLPSGKPYLQWADLR